jgi:hypothetical protein
MGVRGAIFQTGKIDIKWKTLTRDKGHYGIIRGSRRYNRHIKNNLSKSSWVHILLKYTQNTF